MEYKMSVILVDARHVGSQLRNARRSARMNRYDLAQILNISRDTLAKYETGREIIPESILHRIFSQGIIRLKSRN